MLLIDFEEALEIFRRVGPPPDGEKINQLNEQPGVAVALPADGLDQIREAGDEAIVADAQQRARGNVADAGRFDDDGAGPTAGKPAIPVQDIVGDFAVAGGAPRNHGGHPGAGFELDGADIHRLE